MNSRHFFPGPFLHLSYLIAVTCVKTTLCSLCSFGILGGGAECPSLFVCTLRVNNAEGFALWSSLATPAVDFTDDQNRGAADPSRNAPSAGWMKKGGEVSSLFSLSELLRSECWHFCYGGNTAGSSAAPSIRRRIRSAIAASAIVAFANSGCKISARCCRTY